MHGQQNIKNKIKLGFIKNKHEWKFKLLGNV